MSDHKYGVQSAYLREGIQVGRINKAGTAFLDHEDMTDQVLFAVADYVRSWHGGGMEMTFRSKTDKPDLHLRIEVRDA